jgi:hypothetical protein
MTGAYLSCSAKPKHLWLSQKEQSEIPRLRSECQDENPGGWFVESQTLESRRGSKGEHAADGRNRGETLDCDLQTSLIE